MNHWVTLIAHKPGGISGGENVRFYLLDSLNVKKLHLEEKELKQSVVERVEEKIRLGLTK